MARIPKFLHLSQVSGITSLCDYHHVSGYLFPQSISFWTDIKPTEGPHPHQGLACFNESGLLFRSATTFPGYISMYTSVTFRCIPVVRYTWLTYPLEFLWSEVWKCYIKVFVPWYCFDMYNWTFLCIIFIVRLSFLLSWSTNVVHIHLM